MHALVRSLAPASYLVGVLIFGAWAPSAEAQGCSEATVEGDYAFALQGNVARIGPIAASGITSFDGEGDTSITGFINTRRNRFPAVEADIDGTYEVNADCTGSATFEIPAPGLFNRFTELEFEAVIVDQGREIRYLITTPGVVFAGTSVRLEPSP
jgi:hypothetical protein